MTLSWRDAAVEANGVSTRYRRAGSGPPLVLAHGLTDSARCWARIADDLARDHDVVAYDARGHGRSSLPTGPRAVTDMADDLLALIAALGLERPAVLGHSMGANTAAMAAGRGPEAIGAVLLEDPPWFGAAGPPPPRLADWPAYQRQLQEMSQEDLEALCRRDNPGWHESEAGPWAEAKRQFNHGVFAGGLPSLGDWREVVATVRCPGLLITGDNPTGGAIVTEDAAATALALAPSLRHVRIPGAGHNVRRDNYSAYLAAVRQFLAR